MMATWTDRNPAWQTRFYDDAACVSFVRSEFPEYYDAYTSLPKDVERSDFPVPGVLRLASRRTWTPSA